MSFNSLLNEICTIQKNTPTTNSYNEKINGWSTKYANLSCRLRKNRRQDGNRDLSDFDIGDYILYIKKESNIEILTSDQVLIGSQAYKIVRADTESSKHHFELEISKIL